MLIDASYMYNIHIHSIIYNRIKYKEKITNETLLQHHIMFSNTTDLSKIRLYLSMGYCVVVKYNSQYLHIFVKNLECHYKSSIDDKALLQIKVCSKQDVKNYLRFINKITLMAAIYSDCFYKHNIAILIDSEIFNIK